jgi:hypothetical protein
VDAAQGRLTGNLHQAVRTRKAARLVLQAPTTSVHESRI